MKRRIFTIVCAILLLTQFALAAFAVDQIDLNRRGSISIHMVYDGEDVAGGTITLYRVAEVICEDADYDYKFVGDFVGCGLSLDNLTSANLAKSLSEVAKNKGTVGTKKTIDANGKAKYDDLELGLYLVIQEQNAEGYYAFSPFLVSVPVSQNGVYQYDVDASPKVAVEPTPTTPTTEETTTPTTEETTAPTTEETTTPTTEETTTPTTEETTAPTTEETTTPTTEETTAPTTEETTVPTTEETTAPTTEETTEETTVPSTTGTTEPKLPQTGQMNWPVPVFAVAGIAVFVLGWCLHRSEKKEQHEA